MSTASLDPHPLSIFVWKGKTQRKRYKNDKWLNISLEQLGPSVIHLDKRCNISPCTARVFPQGFSTSERTAPVGYKYKTFQDRKDCTDEKSSQKTVSFSLPLSSSCAHKACESSSLLSTWLILFIFSKIAAVRSNLILHHFYSDTSFIVWASRRLICSCVQIWNQRSVLSLAQSISFRSQELNKKNYIQI